MKKRILSIVICLVLLLSLTACGSGYIPPQKSFDEKVQSSTLSDGEVIAQNSKYSLVYEAETGSVKMVDIANGTVWDITPKSTGEVQYDAFGLPIGDHVFTQAAFQVAYMDKTIRGGGSNMVTSTEGAVEGGRVVVKPIENGVTIEYYFDGQKFMIPVDYVPYACS